jgi:hypothetical protein
MSTRRPAHNPMYGDESVCAGIEVAAVRPRSMLQTADLARPDLAPTMAPPASRARQAAPALDALLAALDVQRLEMRQALNAPRSDARRQMFARRRLLDSLEAYTAALGRRNLPVPPRLRDELSLQRSLDTRPAHRGRGTRLPPARTVPFL